MFIIFEEGISRLSRFASNLPQDQCPNNNQWTGNGTYNGTEYDYDDQLGYNDTYLDSTSQGRNSKLKGNTGVSLYNEITKT